MPNFQTTRRALLALVASAAALPAFAADPTLLNVSYDVARELYKQFNPAFIAAQKAKGQTVLVNQSHGGSSKQIGAVIGGLAGAAVAANITLTNNGTAPVANGVLAHHPHQSAPGVKPENPGPSTWTRFDRAWPGNPPTVGLAPTTCPRDRWPPWAGL